MYTYIHIHTYQYYDCHYGYHINIIADYALTTDVIRQLTSWVATSRNPSWLVTSKTDRPAECAQ